MNENINDQFSRYSILVERSDRLTKSEIKPTLLGLFGELGGVLTASKKLAREKGAYRSFQTDAIEEFGDTLWYVIALGHRLGLTPDKIFSETAIKANRALDGQDTHTPLLELIASASKLAEADPSPQLIAYLREFAAKLVEVMGIFGIPLDKAISTNTKKVSGRFLPLDFSCLPNFDIDYDLDERLPDYFEFAIKQKKSGQTYMSLNDAFIGDLFIGDPLTDSIEQGDGYRFHDVFHMANAAILHWSPVLRSLLKRKRKSNKQVDASEDSGRAIVIEEGLSAWLFSRAKQHDMFQNTDTVSFDILKRISEFVDGYEVQRCPQALWERAIISGFAVFRALQTQESGVIIGDRLTRTISFRSLS